MFKQLFLIFCFLLFATYVHATVRQNSKNRPQIIPIQLTERGHIFVPVRVNNSEPLWFVLDSGSSNSLLDKNLIKDLKLKVEAVGEAVGAGAGADEALLTSGVTLNLSGIKLRNQEIPAIDFKALEKSLGRNIDGMLGYDFMRRFVVEVDYEAKVVKIYNAAKYRYRGKGESFPITTEDDHPHIRLKVTLPEREPVEGKFIVDGGAGGATLEFASPFIKTNKLLETVEILETKSLAAIGGSVTISYGRGTNIQLGRFSIENPILGFPQVNRGAFANPNIAGLIGSKLLSQFTVIYDDKRRRIIFEPNSSFIQTAQPKVSFSSGLVASKIPFEWSGDGHIFLRVRVNNSEPLLFGFESGFEQSAITTKQAKALNLNLYGEAQVTGGGENTEDISFTKDVAFDLSGVKFKLKEIWVLALDFPSSVPDEAIGGMLGYDFISRFVVEIDFIGKVINLYNPQSYRYRGHGNILPIKMIDNYPAIPGVVSLPGLKPISAMFGIDTGAGNDIFFYSPFVKKHKLLDSKQETTAAETLGIGGTSKIRIGRATSIQLGRTVLDNPSVHFSQATKGDSASTFSAGFIGNGIFRQFKLVIFDQTRRRLILEPNVKVR